MLIAYSQNTDASPGTIEEMMAQFSMSNLRLPLHAAIMLSPLCLLTNMRLNIHSAAEDKLCQVSRSFRTLHALMAVGRSGCA